MTATAYLDLFIRHVTDPSLLKAVVKFVMTQKYDDVPILDSLLPRINSSTHVIFCENYVLMISSSCGVIPTHFSYTI